MTGVSMIGMMVNRRLRHIACVVMLGIITAVVTAGVSSVVMRFTAHDCVPGLHTHRGYLILQ
jgi:hypothetical protein